MMGTKHWHLIHSSTQRPAKTLGANGNYRGGRHKVCKGSSKVNDGVNVMFKAKHGSSSKRTASLRTADVQLVVYTELGVGDGEG